MSSQPWTSHRLSRISIWIVMFSPASKLATPRHVDSPKQQSGRPALSPLRYTSLIWMIAELSLCVKMNIYINSVSSPDVSLSLPHHTYNFNCKSKAFNKSFLLSSVTPQTLSNQPPWSLKRETRSPFLLTSLPLLKSRLNGPRTFPTTLSSTTPLLSSTKIRLSISYTRY